MIQYKKLKKLYLGKYQHKIVLVCAGVHYFRGGNLDRIEQKLNDVINNESTNYHRLNSIHFTYLFSLLNCLRTLDNYTIRVESPWLSIYTTEETNIDKIKNVSESHVREIYGAPDNLAQNELVSSLPFDYRIHVKNNHQTHEGFLDWARDNKNIRLTKNISKALSGSRWPINGYFYIKGEKNLTMAKMYLGNIIKKVEKIINL